MNVAKKTISLPKHELALLERAKEHLLKTAGVPVMSDSQVMRIGLQALFQLDRKTLEKCVEECPEPKPGKPKVKPRKELTEEDRIRLRLNF